MTMNAIAIAIGAGPFLSNLLQGLTFFLPLSDAGAGAVNLSAAPGSGSATFTRATSATTWSSAGLLLTVAPGVARSTYSELTGAIYLGFLSEEARTNQCLWNRDFTNAAWVATTMTVAKDQTGIDGAASAASSLLATGANSTVKQTITIAAVSRPFSVYVKRLTGTGNIDLAQDGATYSTIAVANDGLYHRITLTASQLNPVLSIRLVTSGDKIAVDYASLEDTAGAAPVGGSLSPIATTTVAVTRNRDQLSYPVAGNLDNTVGTLYAEITPANTPAVGALWAVAGDTVANRFLFAFANAASAQAFDGTNNPSLVFTPVGGTTYKVATKWGASFMTLFKNGTALAAAGAFDNNFDIAVLGVGTSSGVTNLNGTTRNLKIWTRALSDAEVASL